MATVIWTDDAVRRLVEIAEYVRQFDPIAADGLANRLLKAGNGLSSFPGRGRPMADGKRELPSVPPYILRYRIEGETVIILGIRHGARHPRHD